jgi:hypothetical protein
VRLSDYLALICAILINAIRRFEKKMVKRAGISL